MADNDATPAKAKKVDEDSAEFVQSVAHLVGRGYLEKDARAMVRNNLAARPTQS